MSESVTNTYASPRWKHRMLEACDLTSEELQKLEDHQHSMEGIMLQENPNTVDVRTAQNVHRRGECERCRNALAANATDRLCHHCRKSVGVTELPENKRV